MHRFIQGFVREPTGAWRCVKASTLDLPTGRIQVAPGSVFMKGTRFMNIDLAELLETEWRKSGPAR